MRDGGTGGCAARITARWAFVASIFILAAAGIAPLAQAQTPVGIDDGRRLESVEVRLENPSPDAALNQRVMDRIRVGLGIYPGEVFVRSTAEFNLARARRVARASKTTLVVSPGPTGGVAISIMATLGPAIEGTEARGALVTGKPGDLPVLYDKDGFFLRLRLESIGMYYGNNNAWYANPRLLLAGNPLVRGRTAGPGYSGWAEGFLHSGIYAMAPLGSNISLYGGFSGIYSASAGQELFTNQTRGYYGVEDAFVGLVGGTTSEQGDRLIVNASIGRQRFGVSDGFIIANTASNGSNRAALQSNPRWAADRLGLVQFRYNNTKVEAFYLNPDELPAVNSRTGMGGVNAETKLPYGFDLGFMYLQVLKSEAKYFTTTGSFSRDGLQVYNPRLRWQPDPAGGLFVAAEAGIQRHDRIAMRATGWTTEIGYAFGSALPWSPTMSYRYASFSGDKPSTRTFERWDPLLSGDNGERWVQGINHFKIFQDSNLNTHRIQLRLRPLPQVELAPQLWFFSADRTTNLGGNPAFSVVRGDYLGMEANLTAKWFISPNVLLQGHIASTLPSDAVRRTIGSGTDPWVSTMVFLRVGL